MEFVRYFLQKSAYKKICNMLFNHFISLKLIKTTQKYLILWNLLGVLISKVFMKSFIHFISPYSLYQIVFINKSAFKKLKQ